jgi:hypothetical protein
VDAREEGGLVLLSNPFGVVGNGLVHEFVVLLPPGEFLPFVEDLRVDFYFFVLVGEEEVLSGGLDDPLFAVELLDALQTTLVDFVVLLDAVELHYAHGCFIYNTKQPT